MFYIVKIKLVNRWYQNKYQSLDEAVTFMASVDYYCELFAWITGKEMYMGNNRDE